MDKDFEGWNSLKQKLDKHGNLPTFSEREIWWCSIGVNVGFEVFGKNRLFSRPVLIVKKYSKLTFFGLPLTSRRKDNKYHYPFDFDGEKGSILLDQGKVIDCRRLCYPIGKVMPEAFEKIKGAFIKALQ